MKEIIGREVVYMSLETGEVKENHAEAMELNRVGEPIQVMFRNLYKGGEWGPLTKGPIWEPFKPWES